MSDDHDMQPSETPGLAATPADTTNTAAATAGSLLRQARQARGLHIAALAASIKVSQQKLEALEADRFDELPGATFTRALAQTICRTLKVDAGPVLALLPSAGGQGLEQMSRGLNEPFRDRPGRQPPTEYLSFLKNPVVVGAIGLVALAAVVYLLPDGWVAQHLRLPQPASAPATASPASGVTVDVLPAAPVVSSQEPVFPEGAASETVFPGSGDPAPTDAAPSTAAASSVAAPVVAASAARPATGALLLKSSAESWVEVVDARGVRVLSRMLQPGETVGVDGTSPLRVKIGNAAVTEVSWKGQRVDLAPSTTRGNVATLEIK